MFLNMIHFAIFLAVIWSISAPIIPAEKTQSCYHPPTHIWMPKVGDTIKSQLLPNQLCQAAFKHLENAGREEGKISVAAVVWDFESGLCCCSGEGGSGISKPEGKGIRVRDSSGKKIKEINFHFYTVRTEAFCFILAVCGFTKVFLNKK